MQAIILAAGMGSRLGTITAEIPKCMVQVGNRTIIERTLVILRDLEVEEVIIVTGYKHHVLEDFVKKLDLAIPIRFICNHDFATTNNIVSLWLAQPLIRCDFFLIESDVVFSEEMLRSLTPGSTASLSPLQPWMNGTVVTLNAMGNISAMYSGKDPQPCERLYKTVNLYHFDIRSWNTLWPRLDRSVKAGITGAYYETIFASAIRDKILSLRGHVCQPTTWHEIDTPEDLAEARMKAC